MRARAVLATSTAAACIAFGAVVPAAAGPAGFLAVSPTSGDINGNGWTPGDTVSVTVDDDTDVGNGVRFSVTVTVDDEGRFSLHLPDEIRPGDIVAADTGTDVKTHTVVALAVTGRDVDADLFTGTGPAGGLLYVDVSRIDDAGDRILPEGEIWDLAVAGDGTWEADLGAAGYDVTRLDDLAVTFSDGDGDSTTAYGEYARPAFQVLAASDEVVGSGWLPGDVLTLTLDDDADPDNGYVFRLDDVAVTSQGEFAEHLIIDIVPGHHVTVAGDVTKHVRVEAIEPLVDRQADTVSATTTGRGWVIVNAYEGALVVGDRFTNVAPDGTFMVDFTVPGDGWPPHDLTAATGIGIHHFDGNGDTTALQVEPLTQQPGAVAFDVAVRADTVRGTGWDVDTTVQVTVDDDGDTGNGTLQEVFTTTGDLGHFDVGLQFDAQPGHTVTVTDGAVTRAHIVRDLAITSIDRGGETVAGTSAPHATVTVMASDQLIEASAQRLALADAGGTWSTDFQGRLDLTNTTEVTALRYDDDGDSTSVVIPAPNPVLAGANRDETATAVSRATYGPGEANAVVVARRDQFADALAGTPFAVAFQAPLLLTATGALPSATAEELQRVLDRERTVYLLGGEAAIGPEVAAQVRALGYQVQRIAGPDRYATAAAIADRVPNPTTVLLTTGLNFPDGLAAGAVAPRIGAVVLLTRGDQPAAATTAWLDAHAWLPQVAIGGPAARAHPSATPVWGASREDTALLVAERWFDDPVVIGIARRDDFPDALAGGVHVGWAGGPMLLTSSSGLHPGLRDYLYAHAPTIDTAYAYGGSAALSPAVLAEIVSLIGS